AQLAAHISQRLDRYRHDIQRGSLPFERKRRIVEAFVREVRVRLPKGHELSGQVREVVPFREHEPHEEKGAVTAVWIRGQQEEEEPTPCFEVLYRFPWPKAENLTVNDSPSPKRQSNIKTLSAIPA